MPWFMVFIFHLQSQQGLVESFSCCHFSGSLLSPSSIYKDSCDYIVPIWIVQDNVPISRLTD